MLVKPSLLILSALFAAHTSAQALPPTEKTCFDCVHNNNYWNKTSKACTSTYSESLLSTGNDCFSKDSFSFNLTTVFDPIDLNNLPRPLDLFNYKEVNTQFINSLTEPMYIRMTCYGNQT